MKREDWLNILRTRDRDMRNYELINEIYAELVAGNGKGQFSNPYLNTVITLTKLIEKERPELKSMVESAKRQNWMTLEEQENWEKA